MSNRFRPVYALYMHAGDRFLLAAQKRTANKTSNYVMSMDKRDLSRESAAYLGKIRLGRTREAVKGEVVALQSFPTGTPLSIFPPLTGKLRSNFVGTEYTVYDDGYSPDKKDTGKEYTMGADRTPKFRQELCE